MATIKIDRSLKSCLRRCNSRKAFPCIFRVMVVQLQLLKRLADFIITGAMKREDF